MVQGGISYSSSTFSEDGDLYLFQLKDAYYTRCSATGRGLTIAKAGVKTMI